MAFFQNNSTHMLRLQRIEPKYNALEAQHVGRIMHHVPSCAGGATSR